MKVSKYILISMVLSLLLHLLLLLTLAEVGIVQSGIADVTAIDDGPIDITILPMPKSEPEPETPDENTADNSSEHVGNASELLNKGYADPEVKEIFEKQKLTAPLPSPKINFAGLKTSEIKPDLPTPQAAVEASAPRPEIVAIDIAALPKNSNLNRVTIPKVERIDVPDVKLPSLLPPGPVVTGQGASYNVSMMFTPGDFGAPNISLGENDGGDGQGGGGGSGKNIDLGPMPPQGDTPSPDVEVDNSVIVSFEEFVDIKVIVKEDTMTGGGYFMASIKANEKADAVREIPKDIVIILDRSSSITPKKFSSFREAAVNSLEYLNTRDRFNVVTFTDKPVSFSQACIPATDANRAAARRFINGLSRGGTTSVFDGIQPYVKATVPVDNVTGRIDIRRARPLNIFLLTDGISTVNIYKDDDFLRKITGFNPGNVSIFAFCAGADANRDLLDFLGFLNRGQSFHARQLEDVKKNLRGFITNHSSLLIRDIEYMADKGIVKEIYSKKLQHLYRGSDVKIFGCYGPNDTEIVLRVVGYDCNNTRRDVMFRRTIADCEHTDKPIDMEWAAKKIIHLLADKTLAVSPQEKSRYDAEINRIKAKFNLAVPY